MLNIKKVLYTEYMYIIIYISILPHTSYQKLPLFTNVCTTFWENVYHVVHIADNSDVPVNLSYRLETINDEHKCLNNCLMGDLV
jgi:hypothetical protein